MSGSNMSLTAQNINFVQIEYLNYMMNNLDKNTMFFSIIGGHALNNIISGINKERGTNTYSLPREVYNNNIDTILIVEPSTDYSKNKRYSEITSMESRVKTFEPIILGLDTFAKEISTKIGKQVSINYIWGKNTSVKRYIFPGVLLQVMYDGNIPIVDMSLEINAGLNIVNAYDTLCDIATGIPYLNVYGWSILQYFGVNPDDNNTQIRKMTSDYTFIMKQFNNVTPYANFLQELLYRTTIFNTTLITEYHFLGANITDYLLKTLNIEINLTDNQNNRTTYVYTQYKDKVENGGILEYARKYSPDGNYYITLRNVINQCISNISNDLTINQIGVIAKSGGEVSIYRGMDIPGEPLPYMVNDIDSKVWIIDDKQKEKVYQIIIYHLLILTIYIDMNNFMETFINEINKQYKETKSTLFNEDFTIMLSNLDPAKMRNTTARSIQIGESNIQLFSMDMFAQMNIMIHGNIICSGLVQSSPLDIAIEQSVFDWSNIDPVFDHMWIVSQSYIKKDLTTLLKNPERTSKREKDKTRLAFYEQQDRPIIPERAQYLSASLGADNTVGYPVNNILDTTRIIFPSFFTPELKSFFTGEFTKLLNSAMTVTRYKSPKSVIGATVDEDTLNVYGGGKYIKQKARKQKARKQKARKQKTKKQKTKKQKTKSHKTKSHKTKSHKTKSHKLRNNKPMNSKSRKT